MCQKIQEVCLLSEYIKCHGWWWEGGSSWTPIIYIYIYIGYVVVEVEKF